MPRIFFIGFLCLFIIKTAFAQVNLIQVYEQALKADPELAKEHYNVLSIGENIAINKADLLPNIGLTGSVSATDERVGNPNQNGNVAEYKLDLRQHLFDFGSWLKFQGSKLSVKSAQASYAASLEHLIVRVLIAYFNQSEAYASWQLSHENHVALAKELKETELRFKAGLTEEADVANAQAAYDNSTTDVITAFARWQDTQSQLEEITGVSYNHLALLKHDFTIQTPEPEDLSKWLLNAKKQNLNLLSKHFAADAARENIRLQHAGNYPVVDASIGFSGNRSQNNGLGATNSETAVGTLDLNLPIYQGGLVIAQTKQAQYDYQSAIADYLLTYRLTISQVEQNYHDVLANIAKIHSGKLAIASNLRSFQDTQIAYKTGLRGMIDVLTARQNLYQVEQRYLQARYDYFESMMQLKEATGILSLEDVKAINLLLV